jgi:hypothetical protein
MDADGVKKNKETEPIELAMNILREHFDAAIIIATDLSNEENFSPHRNFGHPIVLSSLGRAIGEAYEEMFTGMASFEEDDDETEEDDQEPDTSGIPS